MSFLIFEGSQGEIELI